MTSPSGPSLLHSTMPPSFQELPDPEKVSTEVQQMWVLTEVIRARQAAARIGRFDVSPAALPAGLQPHCMAGGAILEGLLPAGWGEGLGGCHSKAMVLCRDRRLLSVPGGRLLRYQPALLHMSSAGAGWRELVPLCSRDQTASSAPASAFVPAARGGVPGPPHAPAPITPALAGSGGSAAAPEPP